MHPNDFANYREKQSRLFRPSSLLSAIVAIAGLLAIHAACATAADNLVQDGSFEQVIPRDQFGHVFRDWGGWKYEGECEFRVGQVAHSGKTSCLLFGSSQPKIRISQTLKSVPPGRYQLTAWLRGLDLGEGVWHMTTELAIDDKYIHLKKNGTFGWTPLTYVVDVKQQKDLNAPIVRPVGAGLLVDRRRASRPRAGRHTAERRARLGQRRISDRAAPAAWPPSRSAATNAATRTCRPGATVMPAADCWRPPGKKRTVPP